MYPTDPRYRIGLPLIIAPINEEWRYVELPGIKPFYMISNFGRVYNYKKGHLLKYYMEEKRGYLMVTLRSYNKQRGETFLVHRLVMMVFNPIINPEEMQVNHIDGVKTNNYIGNLEWCTHHENIEHAIRTGLFVNGEEGNIVKLSAEQVHLICQCLEQRLDYKYICEQVLNVEYTDDMVVSISSIKSGKNWGRIRAQYNIPEGRTGSTFTDEEIHKICSYLEQGIKTNDILYLMGIDRNQFTQREYLNLQGVIGKIRRKERYTRISNNYNF